MTTFKELGLNSEIMKSLDDLGFTEPSPIQEKAIEFLLKSKKDLIALAQTGTGKTAAFGLPILNQIDSDEKELSTIILCPTRELCIQIARDMKRLAKHLKQISITPVYGGERIDIQIRSLRRGTNIVVGTPGRVHDLIRRKVLHLQDIKWLVLDEADEMLDMGFKDDLDAILKQTPKTRQTLLFSATMSKSVQSIAKRYMKDAREISIGQKNIGAENVSHEYYIVSPRSRFEALKRILDYLPGVYGILFCRTRRETQDIADRLKQAHYDTEALHGEISQDMRTKIMDRFKKKKSGLLVATDVAARGIDVSDLTHVINYNLPDQNEGYTHRSGRTGRAQKSGTSIIIISPREVGRIKKLESIIGKKIEPRKVPNKDDVHQKQIDNFLKEIEGIDIKEIEKEKYFPEVEARLQKMHKEDLIKYIIAHKLSHLLNTYQSDDDLNAIARTSSEGKSRVISGESVSLKINFGKRHGFDIKEFFSLINSSRNLKGLEIGRINLMPEYSVFSIEKGRADEVTKNLEKLRFRGEKVIITKSTKNIGSSSPFRGRKSSPTSSSSRSKRSGPSRSGRSDRGGDRGKRARYRK